MNKLTALFIILCLTLFFYACNNKTSVVEKSFHVWGNAAKCKINIENASTASGVSQASWDENTKLLKLKIDTTIVSYNTILKQVANAGYDNELFLGNDYAYSKLDPSCQYERRAD